MKQARLLCSLLCSSIKVLPWPWSVISFLWFISPEREISRKKYVQGLETRTPEQLAEEEALYIEIKRLEQSERQFRKERDNLLRTLAGIESGLPDVVDDDSPFGGAPVPAIEPKKKKKGNMEIESPITPSTISLPPAPVSVPIMKRPVEKLTAQDIQNCIFRTEPPSGTYKSGHHPAHLRSFRLPQPKGAQVPKVTQVFAELGVAHGRMVMYTRENIAHFDSLLESVNNLLDLKKMVDKVEQDIRVAKGRLGIRASEAPSNEGNAMEVDAEDGEADEDGRAQSVMSARSTRSRKQSRRSSVSSVDASSARGTVKRQKKT
jgi:DNA methyltransferase 1-associated protein 1